MITRKLPILALAGSLAIAFTASAFAQVGGGTELPSSAKKGASPEQSGSPANEANNGGAGSMTKKGGSMKKDDSGSTMKKDDGSMSK